MKIAVLGASGRAGSEIIKELAHHGHQIVGIARNEKAIPSGAGIVAVAGDASDARALADQIEDSEAVISARPFDVETILEALRLSGVGSLLVTGGAGSLEIVPGIRLVDSPDFPAEWKARALKGVIVLEKLRQERDVDWTFLSLAAMIFEGPRTERFRVGAYQLLTDASGESRISFADYAIAMVDELEQYRHSRWRFTVAY